MTEVATDLVVDTATKASADLALLYVNSLKDASFTKGTLIGYAVGAAVIAAATYYIIPAITNKSDKKEECA